MKTGMRQIVPMALALAAVPLSTGCDEEYVPDTKTQLLRKLDKDIEANPPMNLELYEHYAGRAKGLRFYHKAEGFIRAALKLKDLSPDEEHRLKSTLADLRERQGDKVEAARIRNAIGIKTVMDPKQVRGALGLASQGLGTRDSLADPAASNFVHAAAVYNDQKGFTNEAEVLRQALREASMPSQGPELPQ